MTTQFLTRPAGTIAYDDTGHGPLVICAPSLGDVRGEYRFLAPQLTAAGYRVVTTDLRGLGESSTGWSDYSVTGVGQDLVALIETLNAGPATLIGCSMAAGAAVYAAAEAPDRVNGLVLIGPFVRGTTSTANRLLFSTLFARPWGVSAWLRYYASLYPTRKPADFTAYTAALHTNLAEPGRLAVLHQMLFAPKTASEERLPRVTAPALVLMGSKDPDFKSPETEARWVADQLHGQLVMVPDAGHYPHAEMPDIVGHQVLSFLATTQPAPEQFHVA